MNQQQSYQSLIATFINFLSSQTDQSNHDPDSIEVINQCLCQEFRLDQQNLSQYHGDISDLLNTELQFIRFINSNSFVDVLNQKEILKGTDSYALAIKQARTQFYRLYAPHLFFFPPESSSPPLNASSVSNVNKSKDSHPSSPNHNKEQAELLKADANSELLSGNVEKSILLYSQAIDLFPTSIYYANRAAALMTQKEWQKAEADCRKALELDPKYYKALLRLAQCLFHQKQYKESLNTYDTILNSLDNDVNDQKRNQIIKEMEEVRYHINNPPKNPNPSPNNFDLSSLLSNPSIQSMASSLLSNPQVMQGVMNAFQPSNPNPTSDNTNSNETSSTEHTESPSLNDLLSSVSNNPNFQQLFNNLNSTPSTNQNYNNMYS